MQPQSVEDDNKTSTSLKRTTKKHLRCLKPSGCFLIIYGNGAIILGLSLIMLQSTIMSYIVENLLNLNSDTSIFKMWQKYPVKVPHAFTFFNWTNHKDFFNRSIKPKFEEIGPYTFLQEMERVDIVRNDNNNTITFKQIHTYEYDINSYNNGNLSDRLITINYFSMLVAHLINDFPSSVKDIYSEYVSTFDPNFYLDTTIDNQILKGSNNIIMELGNYFEFIIPEFPRWDGFGWAKIRNGEPNFDGVYNIANGVNRQFDVLNWNYNNITSSFNESCNKVKGSVGDIYSFPLNKESITIFSAELCRYIELYFEKEVIIDGIIGYKYSFTKLTLDNGTINPENKCFCIEPCAPSGVFSLSSCRYNVNDYVSLPHYYNADPMYLEGIDGLKPEKDKHESYIVVEPNSLLGLEFKISVQLSMFLHPVEGISFFDNFPKLYFPLVWMKMHVQLPDVLKTYLRIYLIVPYIIIGVTVILITLGILMTCYGVYKFKRSLSLERSQSMDQNFIERVPLNE